jgi:hypothetical protein
MGDGELKRNCVMSIFKMIAKPTAVALTVVSMACMAGTAQAQSGKRLIVAMASADPVQDAKPALTPAPAMTAPSAKRVAAVVAPAKTGTPDCFWCNRTVVITGLSM